MSDLFEIKNLVVAQGEAWNEFKTASESRFSDLENYLCDLGLASNRQKLGWRGGGDGGADSAHKQAFFDYMRTGRELDLESKSMSSTPDPDGGYLIPKQIDAALSKILIEYSPMRQLATVLPVKTSDFSMLHSVGGTGFAWVGETGARPETGTPTFNKISPVLGEVYCSPPITQNLLDDSAFDLENWLISELSETFADAEGDAFINGNGIVKPRGILTYNIASTADGTRGETDLQYVASGAAGAFASTSPSDKLIKLVHALKPRYRKGASWLMNTGTMEQVRVLKDGQGNYIWRAGLEAGQPDLLLGYPVFEDENLPDIASNSLSIAFGNFQRGYTVIDRSTSMLRDPFTSKPYVLFYSTKRVGGSVRDFRAIKLMKFAAS